jgi:uncharacterized membrane protein YccC
MTIEWQDLGSIGDFIGGIATLVAVAWAATELTRWRREREASAAAPMLEALRGACERIAEEYVAQTRALRDRCDAQLGPIARRELRGALGRALAD